MLSVVGNGEAGDACGDPVLHFCADCRAYFGTYHSCMSRYCPRCYSNWAAREARAAAARIWSWLRGGGTAEYRRATKDWLTRFRLYHIVVSFNDDGEVDEDGVREYRQRAYRRAAKHGVHGGLAIFHGGRAETGYRSGGPHVHILAVGGLLAPGGMDAAERRGDVVWKVIARDGRWHIPNEMGARRAVAYLLTHCLVGDGFHSLTWFGAVAYNKWSSAEPIARMKLCGDLLDDEAILLCPYCMSENVIMGEFVDRTDFGRMEGGPVDRPPPPLSEMRFTVRIRVDPDEGWGTLVSWGSWEETRPILA